MQTSTINENAAVTSESENLQLCRYWMSWIKRAKKQQPSQDWIDAEKALKGEEPDLTSAFAANSSEKNGLPYVNGYREQYEALKSFLDQTEADFRVAPSDAFMGDVISGKQAEADYAYLKYVWRDQRCQIAQSKKLDSALRRNVGYTMPTFDKKKWMPTVKYIPAKNVALDPDCEGDLDKASAIVYWDYISLENLKAQNPDLSKEDLDKISKKALSSLDNEELSILNKEAPEDNEFYTVVCLYHVYARNDAAVRILKNGEADIPDDDSLVVKLQLTTPKRYLEFVEGLDRPLKDQDHWDLEIDDNEWPITKLSFNTPSEDLYGYTDYSQMKRIDKMCNNIMYDIERNAFHTGNKKFAGTPESGSLTKEGVEGFLNDPKTTYHPDLIGSDGRPKIQQIDTGKYEPALIQAYSLADESRKAASALGELLSTEVEQWKDVTAIATRIHDANVHQRVNRRLNGPEGYEQSITEDAIKILEIAHQYVPAMSTVEIQGVEQPMPDVPWPQAIDMMRQGAAIIELGADAVIGPELAKFWRTSKQYPSRIFKLSTNVAVMPGSTRSITAEQKAILMKQYYLECYQPFYAATNRPDLMNEFLSRIGHLAGIDGIDELLPETLEMKQFMEQQDQKMQQEEERMDQQQRVEVIKTQADIESKMQKEENGAGNANQPV